MTTPPDKPCCGNCRTTEDVVERRIRIYHRERLKEEASLGLCQLIDQHEHMNRTEFAKLIGCRKSFVTKILDSHNFTLETLSDAYFALGYALHLNLVPHEQAQFRPPSPDHCCEHHESKEKANVMRTPDVGRTDKKAGR